MEPHRAQPLPDELITSLVEHTGAADAPLAWVSLRRGVDEGLTTWEAFWADPGSEDDGMRLVNAVMQSSRSALSSGLGALEDSEESS